MDGESLDLSAIPGLGPARLRSLENAGVRTLTDLLAMELAQLAAIRGIGMWQARRIREFLRHHGLQEAEGPEGERLLLAPPGTSQETVEEAIEAVQAAEENRAMEEEAATRTLSIARALERARRKEQRMAAEEEAARHAALEAEANELLDETVTASEEPDTRPVVSSSEGPIEAASPEAPAETGEDDAPGLDELVAQRESLPDTAIALMEAIRQSAVTPQLTRQITRLMITSGELLDPERDLTPEQRRRAARLLRETDALLQRALQRERFSPREQREVAERVRRRRRELDDLLARG